MREQELGSITSQDWMETHAEPFVLIDADYTIVAANAAYSAAYGAEPEAIVGRKCHQVSHRSDEPCHRHGENCPHRTVFTSGGPTQVIHVHFDAAGRAERVRLSANKLSLPDGSILMSESVQRLAPQEEEEPAEMVGGSASYRQMLEQLTDVAPSDLPVLLTGETGSGKEMAAQFIHRHSRRCSGPLVVIDCTSIPEALFESGLFGHEKGAFTGTSSRRIGLVEEAEGGTLFLDEIGELPLPVQAKLLRFAERGEFRRLGANRIRHIDCRIISATHRPLQSLILADGFRRDLYYRLAGVEIRVPALVEREKDVLLIAAAMLQRSCGRGSRLSEAAKQALLRHPFPGNIRELRNVILRAAQAAGGQMIEDRHLGLDRPEQPCLAGPAAAADASRPFWHAISRSISAEVRSLCACGLSRRAVADRLGVSERTVYRHLARQNSTQPPGSESKEQGSAQGSATSAASMADSRYAPK